MLNPAKQRLIAVDRLDDSIVVAFADGRCAEFSAQLLYSMLPQADEVQEEQTIAFKTREDQRFEAA